MDFDVYDCKKIGFFKQNPDSLNFHDKALEKAEKKIYNLPKEIQSKPYKTLFLANLNKKTKEDAILNEFKNYGEIISLKLIKDLITNDKKGYGFLEYKHFSSAFDAYKTSQNLLLDNQKIIVDFERGRLQKGWKPRRKGGGLGGEKNSGQMRFSKNILKKAKHYH